MEKIISICIVCGVSFPYYESRHGVRKYCSQTCYNKQRDGKPPIWKACKCCGRRYKTKYARRNRSKYCSRQCANAIKAGVRYSPDTEFKKGHKVNEELPFLSITQRTYKGDKPRNWIKTLNGEWIPLASFIWESIYGKLKEGDVIHHLNGDTLDDRIKNLIALPRADHPKYHGRWGLKEIEAEKLAYYRSRYDD